MPQSANQKIVITTGQYQGLIAPPPGLPTPGECFDFQIEGLVDRKYATYGDADPFRNRLPEKGFFLFVPPRPEELDLNGLMSNVELNGKTGVNYLDVSYLTPAVEVPGAAHLLLDVEDGRARLNVKPKVSRQNILAEKRHPYDIWRGIIHVTLFPEHVLGHHYMDLVGARCGEDYVPILYVVDDKPALNLNWEGLANPRWGAPSAGSVMP
jgi:hypothetical protein